MSHTVEIKAQFVRSLPAEGVYRIKVDIIDIVNIDFDVLVFDTEHDTFSRVCSVYDLESFPVGKAAAATAGLAYYRGRGVEIDYFSINSATEFQSVTTNRLKLLAVAWSSIVDAFEGTAIVSVDSSVTE